jgi:hypothetical protein
MRVTHADGSPIGIEQVSGRRIPRSASYGRVEDRKPGLDPLSLEHDAEPATALDAGAAPDRGRRSIGG